MENSTKNTFKDFRLETCPEGLYKVIIYGALQVRNSQSFIVVYLHPFNLASPNIKHYQPNLIVERSIKFELMLWFPIGTILNNLNVIVPQALALKSFKLSATKTEFFSASHPADSVEPKSNLIPYFTSFGFITDKNYCSAIAGIPFVRLHVYSGDRVNPKPYDDNYTLYLIPSSEIVRFFFMGNINLAGKVLDNSYNDEAEVSGGIVEVESGKKKIASIRIKSGYSEVEKKLLTWLLFSSKARKVAEQISNSRSASMGSSNFRYLMAGWPVQGEVTISFSGTLINTNKRVFLIERIHNFSSELPFNEIDAELIDDPRSAKNNMSPEEYEKLKLTVRPGSSRTNKENSDDWEVTGEDPWKKELEAVSLTMGLQTDCFLATTNIPIRTRKKTDQDSRTKKISDIDPESIKGGSAAEESEADSSHIKIDAINAEYRDPDNRQRQNEFLIDLTKWLSFSFDVQELFKHKSIDAFVYSVNPYKTVRYFYLIEREGTISYDKRVTLFFDSEFGPLDFEQLLFLATEKFRSERSLRSYLNAEGLAMIRYNRFKNFRALNAAEMSSKIEKGLFQLKRNKSF